MDEVIEITFYGNIPGKKNQWHRGKGGGIYMTGKNSQVELDSLAEQIPPECRNMNLVSPAVNYKFYIPKDTKGHRAWSSDWDNRVSTIQDILVQHGVFKNDTFKLHNGRKVIEPAETTDGVDTLVVTITPKMHDKCKLGDDLVSRIAEAIGRYEGFFLTSIECEQRKVKWPTASKVLRNPGMIRQWSGRIEGQLVKYPQRKIGASGYFVDFGGELEDGTLLEGEEEGWRVLKVIIQQYIDGKYTGGKKPTIKQMMDVYAPSGDKNNPSAYAEYIAKRVNIPLDETLHDVQCGFDVKDSAGELA